MRQTELQLKEARSIVDGIRAKGLHQSREVNRAHILSCLDRGIPESQIMDVLGLVARPYGVHALRTCKEVSRWHCSMWERSGRPRQYDTDAEARVTALAVEHRQRAGSAGRWSS